MKLADITIGQAVKVTRGYSVRPAIITSIFDGRVNVHFTDVDHTTATGIPEGYRGGLFGATVRPNAIQPQ